jgi:5-methylcytosine-specific restriction endonuclease McrA
MKGYHKHRDEVFSRDGHKCRQCGATENLTLDHIVSIASGGTSDVSNLQTLCRSCNVKKSDR